MPTRHEAPPRTAAALLAEIGARGAAPRTRVELDGWVDPEVAFLELMDGRRYAAWLDAGIDATSGWSYLCEMGPSGYALTGTPELVSVRHLASSTSADFDGTILDALDAVEAASAAASDPDSPAAGDPGRFDLGWVGFIGYESGAAALDVPFATEDDGTAHRPDSGMLFIDRLIAFDHGARRVILTTFAESDGALDWLDRAERSLRDLQGRRESAAADEGANDPLAVGVLRHSPDAYRAMILACQEAITAGDAYQLCLTNRITVSVEADPLSIYRRLRRINPTPRGGFIVLDDLALASSSPELFLRVSPDGRLETRPIKGTRPRGADARTDELLREELLESEKERAENLMIVDLMRNDFTRVAELGSVQVPHLFTVEQYANVFQLVSTVRAQLASGGTALSALRSAFPAGSMTGAPKARAMGILAGLERGPRGAYAGAFGYLSVDGGVELSMTIRTVVLDRGTGTATIGTGGGITALSQPDEEIAEMLLKARPVLAALGARLPDDYPPSRQERP